MTSPAQERDGVAAYAKRASEALQKVRPLGGSEMFVQIGDGYLADPQFCGDEIDRLHATVHDLKRDLVAAKRSSQALVEALEKCQRALAMLTEPEAIEGSSVQHAWAHAVEAEAAARAALAAVREG